MREKIAAGSSNGGCYDAVDLTRLRGYGGQAKD
jgi:hypothetical protein